MSHLGPTLSAFKTQNHALCLVGPDLFSSNPASILGALSKATCENLRLDPLLDQALGVSGGSVEGIPPPAFLEALTQVFTISAKPSQFFRWLRRFGMLDRILPELKYCVNLKQGSSYYYDVYEHTLQTMDLVPSNKMEVKTAALFHDIGKYESWHLVRGEISFGEHARASSNLARKWLSWLQAPPPLIEAVAKLILYHEVVDPQFSEEELARTFSQEELWDIYQLWVGNAVATGKPNGLLWQIGCRLARIRQKMK